MAHEKSLAAWLEYIARQHPDAIALGLQRMRTVAQRLEQAPFCPLILVGGTNGKGSCCALLERIYRSAGYRTGLYSSPHLLHYNERVRIMGQPVGDTLLCAAFARVEAARQGVALTYFEFGTLAAWEIFAHADLDVLILEVGMGGRLDATNLYDADCALVSTVDLDHTAYLGNTRAQIGFEKAGIFRAARPAICMDADVPASLVAHAAAIGANLSVLGRDFGYQIGGTLPVQQWRYEQDNGVSLAGLPLPTLRGKEQLANASGVLRAINALQAQLPVSPQEIRRGLVEVVWPGRFQVLPGRPQMILDVAHNPQAARCLAENLRALPPLPVGGQCFALCGLLSDKDVPGVLLPLREMIDRWYFCDLPGPRGSMAGDVLQHWQTLNPPPTAQASTWPTPELALRRIQEVASEDDRIIIFGSFLTVAAAMRFLGRVADEA